MLPGPDQTSGPQEGGQWELTWGGHVRQSLESQARCRGAQWPGTGVSYRMSGTLSRTGTSLCQASLAQSRTRAGREPAGLLPSTGPQPTVREEGLLAIEMP